MSKLNFLKFWVTILRSLVRLATFWSIGPFKKIFLHAILPLDIYMIKTNNFAPQWKILFFRSKSFFINWHRIHIFLSGTSYRWKIGMVSETIMDDKLAHFPSTFSASCHRIVMTTMNFIGHGMLLIFYNISTNRTPYIIQPPSQQS